MNKKVESLASIRKMLILILIVVIVSIGLYSCKHFIHRNNQNTPLVLEDQIGINENDYNIHELQTQDSSHMVTLTEVGSTPTISMPTPMAAIHSKFVVCEEETLNLYQVEDHKWNFYWITLNCDKKLEDCNIMKEFYFDYDYLFSQQDFIQDFTSDWESFLYIPYSLESIDVYRLYQYDGDSKEIKIISPIDNATSAVYSKDNTKILTRGGTTEYHLVDEFGQKKTFITDYKLSIYPSLSPDNNWIAFIGDNIGMPEECRKNSDFYTPLYPYLINTNESGEIIAIGSDPIDNGRCGFAIYDRPIVWDKDSSAIYFANEYGEQEIICTIKIDSHEKNCFDQHKFEKIYKYELFNEKLLIEARVVTLDTESRTGRIDSNIYLLDMETNELRSITDTIAAEIDPIWVEDGSYILYSKDVDNLWQVFITDPYGSFQKQITNSQTNHYLNGMCPGY